MTVNTYGSVMYVDDCVDIFFWMFGNDSREGNEACKYSFSRGIILFAHIDFKFSHRCLFGIIHYENPFGSIFQRVENVLLASKMGLGYYFSGLLF